jgi:Calx-beta domain
LDTAASGYTIEATSDGLTSLLTGAITVVPQPATHLVVVTQPPSSLAPGTSFGLVVAALDPFGNIVTNFGGQVSPTPAGGYGATLGGVTTVTASPGVVSFSGLTLTPTGISAPLEVTSPGLTGTTTNAVGISTVAQLEFAAASATVNQDAGAASIQIVRSGVFSGAVSVDVAISGGTASPGVNYTPINQVLDLAAGQDTETITIPVKDVGVFTPDLTVNLVLSNPGSGAVLGPQATATLVIQSIDQAPLVSMSSVQLLSNNKHQVTEVNIGFSGALEPNTADNKTNYRLSVPGTGGSYTAKNAKVLGIRSAVSSAAHDTVTLTLSKPIALAKPVQLIVSGSTSSGLTDTFGRKIDGDHNGTAGGNATAILSKQGAKVTALRTRSSQRATGSAAVEVALEQPHFIEVLRHVIRKHRSR